MKEMLQTCCKASGGTSVGIHSPSAAARSLPKGGMVEHLSYLSGNQEPPQLLARQSVLPLPGSVSLLPSHPAEGQFPGPEAVVDSIACDLPPFFQMKMSEFLFASSLLVVSFETESCIGQGSCWFMVYILKSLPLQTFLTLISPQL